MRSQDGNSTPKWRRNEKSGWQRYTGKEKQQDQTSSLPTTRSFFPADTLPRHDGRLARPGKLPLTRAQPRRPLTRAQPRRPLTRAQPKEFLPSLTHLEIMRGNKRPKKVIIWNRIWSDRIFSVLHAETQTNAKKYTAADSHFPGNKSSSVSRKQVCIKFLLTECKCVDYETRY